MSDITKEEIEEGLTLFRGNSVEVKAPQKTTIRHRGRMVEIEEPAFVKFSTDFKSELIKLGEFSLKVFIYIGLSIGFETQSAYPGIRKIAEETGMDKDTVTGAVEELEEKGFLNVFRRQGNSNVYTPTRYFSIGRTVPSEGTLEQVSLESAKLSLQNAEVSLHGRVDLHNQINQIKQELGKNEENSKRTLQTDEEQPAYEVRRGSQEWKDKLGAELAEENIEAAILYGKPVTQKTVNKQKEILDLEGMIDAQLARLPYNWSGEDEKEKEHFRKFIKGKRKLGQELETWVNWWMSDEWRVASPPWKLRTVKVKWLNAFQETEKPLRPEYQKFAIPQDDSIPNPKES